MDPFKNVPIVFWQWKLQTPPNYIYANRDGTVPMNDMNTNYQSLQLI